MKTKIILIASCLLALNSFAGVTNITAKFTVEIAGVGTNSSSIKIQQDGSAKDAKQADGAVYAYAIAQTQQSYTNTFDAFLKDDYKNRVVKLWADNKATVDNQVRQQKMNDMFTKESELLTASDLSSIDAILAKWILPP